MVDQGPAMVGIGAAFHINGETRAMRDFLATLRNAGIQTADPLSLHVTIVDCAETAVPIFTERDQLALNRAKAEAGAYLATMPYYELVLTPEEPRLEIYGRRAGIVIAEQNFLFSVREYVGKIFDREAGITLSNRTYQPHMSAGYRTRGMQSATKRIRKPRIPRNLHVNGHDVQQRSYKEDASRLRSPQAYVNKPTTRRSR